MNMRMIFVAIAAVAMVGCGTEEKYAGEAELPKLDALVFKSEGSTIYGHAVRHRLYGAEYEPRGT